MQPTNENALSGLHSDFYFRNCRPEELETWKAFPFDTVIVPFEYADMMNQFIKDTYSSDLETFFRNTLFVCEKTNQPVATCSHWRANGKFNSIHWLKRLKPYEGKELGRSVLSEIFEPHKLTLQEYFEKYH